MNDDQAVLIIGASGHGKSVISVLRAAGYRVRAVINNDPAKWGQEVMGIRVDAPDSPLSQEAGIPAIAAIGDNAERRAAVDRFSHLNWLRLIYPGSYVNPTAEIGPGTVVFPHAILGAEAAIGAHVVVSGQCTIGHDCLVGDYVHLAPGVQVAGGVQIGTGAFLGIGSVVTPGVQIGAGAIVGAGAAVVKDLPEGCRAFGVPARPVES